MEILENQIAPIYSIGTVARMLNVSVQTLRMYEREGLIAPYKSNSNQRWYSRYDVERLQCIRNAIKEQKLSIQGIKKIHALIPCWEIVGCTESDREHCEAYKSHEKGCWSYKRMNNVCAERDCRLCEVYRISNDCGQIKEAIIRITNHATSRNVVHRGYHQKVLKAPIIQK